MRQGLGDLPFFANKATLNSGRLQFEWPYYEDSCGNCANCKGYHIRRLNRDNQKAVYIGDGKSDLCALPEVDLIFAKSFLAEYCEKNKIDYFPFDTFFSVKETLKSMWEDKL
jgi:2-hydroxy-3-keto-5-methylthiopentenyl-1-phosphate phosphatase